MLRFLAFLAILQLAQSSCVKGPSYWCQSVQTANECNAFQHCLQTVWSKQASYTDNELSTLKSDDCQECVKCLYSDVRRCPNLRQFKDEISQLFENNIKGVAICRLIGQCDKPVNAEEIPKKTTTDITRCNHENTCANLDMAVRCSAIEQCMQEWTRSAKSQLKQSVAEMTQKELNAENACGFCIFIMQKYQSVITQNSTEEDAKNYLDSACKLLPTSELSQHCLDQVTTYLPQIIHLLRVHADPGAMCHALQLCHDHHLVEQKFDVSQISVKVVNPEKAKIITPLQSISKSSAPLAVKLAGTEGMGCEMCTIVFNAAKFLVKNEVDDKKVLMFVEKNLCDRLGDYNETCTEYMQKEGEQIIQFLEDEIEPAIICHEFGLCMKSQMTVARQNPFDLRTKNPSSCKQCQSTMDHVKNMMAVDSKDVDVLNYIKEDMCMKSGDMKYLCTSTVDTYSQTILAIIVQDIKSHQLCEMFEVCGIEQKPEEVLFYNLDKPQIEVSHADQDNCVVCQFVMKLLDQQLYKNTTELEIKNGLDKICNTLFPSEYKEQCLTFVDTYTDTVIFLIVKKIPTEYICEVIGLCKQSSHIHEFLKHNDLTDPKKVLIGADEKYINKLSVTSPPKPSAECVMCEFAIQILSKMIKKNTTKDELITAMKNVCNKEMPVQFRDQCNMFINVYGEQIIEMLIQEVDPKTVCQEIKICPKPAGMKLLGAEKLYQKLPMVDLKSAKLVQTVDKDLKIFDEKVGNESIGCSLCIYIAQLTDNFLEKNKTESEIEEELKLVCNYFPAKLEDECKSFIAEYGPYVIQLVASDLDPKEVCAELKLCGDVKSVTSFDIMNKRKPSNN